MRKATQQRLMALFVLIIMAASSLAYVFSGFEQKEEVKPLASFVVNGEVSPAVENMYIQNGFTFLRFYYNNETDPLLINFMNQVPDTFTTTAGQKQVIVQKLEGNETYMQIKNMNLQTDFFNLTQDVVFRELCNNVVVLPTECALLSLNLTG
jgi:hypothetical protein